MPVAFMLFGKQAMYFTLQSGRDSHMNIHNRYHLKGLCCTLAYSNPFYLTKKKKNVLATH